MKKAMHGNSTVIKLWFSIAVFALVSIMGISQMAKAYEDYQTEQEKGQFTFIEGEARKQKLDDVYWENAEENTPVDGGERVKTLISTRAEIQLAELDIIRLAPKTTVEFIKLYQESKDKKRETEIDVNEGDIWANIGSLDASSEMDLNTAVANATVKGTVFRVNVGEDKSTELKVYKGQVDVKGKAPVGEEPEEPKSKSLAPKQIEGPKEVTMKEWTVIVREMQKVIIAADGQLVASREFSMQDRDEQTEWVSWNAERDKVMG
ncbi:MAG: hypothetical protein GF315_11785, partial [candidate division Zixibacteria bacterium]|nr:hypothetical protein [candidate division Zixibacteria bacterium]